MDVHTYSIFAWITATLIGSLGLVVILGSQNLSSKLFAYCTFGVGLWVVAIGLLVLQTDSHVALIFCRLTYFIGSTISAGFFYFFLIYPEDTRPPPKVGYSILLSQVIIAYIFFFTDLIIHDAFPISSPHPWGWHLGPLAPLFNIIFFGFFAAGIVILYRKYRSEKDPNTRSNLGYMFWAVVIGAVPASMTSIILPTLGYFELNWLGPVMEVTWVPIMAYSIIRHRQMNIRIVITEVLAIGMTIMFFINIFLGIVPNVWMRVGAFLAFITLAYYLIEISLREAAQRQELANLNANLAAKVAEQTEEVRYAYELEKKARRDLEKLNETKDQFITITQHHLRTPTTTIRWQLEELMNGSYGTLAAEARNAIEKASGAVGRLVRIIDDFLSITALKVGSKILTISSASLKPLIMDVLEELHIDIKRRNLSVTYPSDAVSWPEISIDASKMREVALIVIENAVRYNVTNGSIDITTDANKDEFRLIVKNTGIGISREDRGKIFGSLFFRGTEARTSNPIGMGVGLSVARAIVRAHHGDLSLHSGGEGKGAKVEVVIPIKQPTYIETV